MSPQQRSPGTREGTHSAGRTWGFRFSPWDALVLVFAAAILLAAEPDRDSPVWAVAVVLGHFFLFCNVFRIHRWKELLWAAVFVINVACWLKEVRIDWAGVLLVQSPVTLGVIAWEMCRPWYHGIFAKRVNPRLEQFLKSEI